MPEGHGGEHANEGFKGGARQVKGVHKRETGSWGPVDCQHCGHHYVAGKSISNCPQCGSTNQRKKKKES